MTRNVKTRSGFGTEKVKRLYSATSSLKKELSDAVVEMLEILADRTARTGLFGEDKDCPCCSTNVDYIPDNALELKYINLDMTGFDNAYISGAQDTKTTKSSGVLKVFNGF